MSATTLFPESPYNTKAPRYRFLWRFQITEDVFDDGPGASLGISTGENGMPNEGEADSEEPADVGTLDWCMRKCEEIGGNAPSLSPIKIFGLIISHLGECSDFIASLLTERLGIPYIHFISRVIQFRKNLLQQWNARLQVLEHEIVSNTRNQLDLEYVQSLVLKSTGKPIEYYRGNLSAILGKISPDELYHLTLGASTSRTHAGGAAQFPTALVLDVEREDNELFEKVVIPPVKNPVVANVEELRRIDSLPQWAQPAFAGLEHLNLVQSTVYDSAFNSSQNMLLSAPTGCGKTNVALLCTLQTFRSFFETGDKKGKVVYIAPMKALAGEITAKFSEALGSLGLVVCEATGDVQIARSDLFSIDVLVTTPEKFDVITRNSNTTGTQSDDSFLSKISCLIIDEVHLLNDARGSVLETVVARLFRLIESTQVPRRVVAISATLPNWQDVAHFLKVSPEHAHYFGREYRHVPLEQIYYGVKTRDAAPIMLDICFDHVQETLTKGKQCIIFVHSRNETITTATRLIEMINLHSSNPDLFQPDRALCKRFHRQLSKCKSDKIRTLSEYCMSIHHAGMVRSDRDLVETMFKEGLIRVLVCTSTLAWGINLPAHCVIVKGTFIGGVVVSRDINHLELMQMLGRAGRPQFDKAGVGIVITEHAKLSNYVRMQVEKIPIESQLHRNLENALNAEIALGSISEECEALSWLQYTFLYVRIRKNPLAYGLKSPSEEDVIAQLRNMVHDAAVNLDRARLIRFSETKGEFASTDLGRIAARYYVDYETIYNFAISINPEIDVDNVNMLAAHVSDNHDTGGGVKPPERPFIDEGYILERLCECKEYESILYRDEELEELTSLMATCLYKPKRGLNHRTTKVSLLIESHINRSSLRTPSLISDMNYIIQNTGRLLLSYFEVATSETVAGPPIGDMIYKWALMFERQMWDINGMPRSVAYHFCYRYHALYDMPKMQSSKLPVLSPVTAARLVKYKLEPLLELTQQELADVVRSKREAASVYSYLRYVPYPRVSFSSQPITGRICKVNISISLDNEWSTRWNGYSESFHIWVCSDSRIINKSKISMNAKKSKDTIGLLVPVQDEVTYLTLKIFSCRWLGIALEDQLVLQRGHAMNDGYTRLLKLLPVPTHVLNHGTFEYPHRYLNPLQSQMFPYCYFSDDNLLVGAPTGSGKTAVAELAIFRLWCTQPQKKAVYIAPLKALAYERLKDWKKKFGSFKNVVEVTGDSRTTAKEIARSHLIVTTPEKWDGISRHWMQRKYVRSIGLVIIDEVHLLGENRGGVLESIVTRLSFISKLTDTTTRIICLSTALANSRQISDWLSVKPSRLFNFSPAVRPVSCSIYIDGFPLKAYCPRMNSMNRPAFATIMRHDVRAPVLVFVSSRRQTHTTAQDFVGLLQQKSLKWTSYDTLKEPFMDGYMNLFVEHGVGIHHAGLHDSDRTRIEEMFLQGQIKVLIATSTLAWGVNLPAKVVIIKGTEYYDGKTKKYVDYSITDIMQMVGRAGRSQQDKDAYAYIYTESRKVDFYKAFMFSPFPAESSFHEHIIDSLNSEIASGTVASEKQAFEYLKNTFFYLRLHSNPLYYLNIDLLKGCSAGSSTEELASCIITRCLQRLNDLGCVSISYNEESTYRECHNMLTPSLLGILASQYYISCETMANFMFDLNRRSSEITIFKALRILANATEFSEVPLRHNEDAYNMQLSSVAVMPILDSEASNPHAKTFLLFQSRLFGLPVPVFDYNNDLKSILDQMPRIIQALIDLMACHRNLRNLQYLLMLYKHLLTGAHILDPCLTFDDPVDIKLQVMDVRSNKPLRHKVVCALEGWYRCDVTGVNEVDVVVNVSNMAQANDTSYLTLGNEASNVLYGFKKVSSDGSYAFRYVFPAAPQNVQAET